jgi:hypothetical protein
MITPASSRRWSSASAPPSSSSASVRTPWDDSFAPEEKELAAEEQRGLRPSHRIVEQFARRLQVLDRRVPVDMDLRGPELEQHVGKVGGGRRLSERAAEIGNSTLGGAPRTRSAGGLAQRRDNTRVVARRTAQQVRGDSLGLAPGGGDVPLCSCPPSRSRAATAS